MRINESVNEKNINHLADVIEAERFPFQMWNGQTARRATKNFCGTPGCIGGTAAAIWPAIRYTPQDPRSVWDDDKLAAKLHVSAELHDMICYPDMVVTVEFADTGNTATCHNITRAGAVTMLRRLAGTGRCIWYEKEQV